MLQLGHIITLEFDNFLSWAAIMRLITVTFPSIVVTLFLTSSSVWRPWISLRSPSALPFHR